MCQTHQGILYATHGRFFGCCGCSIEWRVRRWVRYDLSWVMTSCRECGIIARDRNLKNEKSEACLWAWSMFWWHLTYVFLASAFTVLVAIQSSWIVMDSILAPKTILWWVFCLIHNYCNGQQPMVAYHTTISYSLGLLPCDGQAPCNFNNEFANIHLSHYDSYILRGMVLSEINAAPYYSYASVIVPH